MEVSVRGYACQRRMKRRRRGGSLAKLATAVQAPAGPKLDPPGRRDDLVYAPLRPPTRPRVAALNVYEMADLVACYDTEGDLTDGERRFLPAALSFACLEQVKGMVSLRESGRSGVTEDDIARGVYVLDQFHAGFVDTA